MTSSPLEPFAVSPPAPAGPDFTRCLVSSGALGAAGRDIPWLWHGYLAPGFTTLLTSQWKAGKTTLLSVLLDRRRAGGELAGRAVTAGKSVVVSEEPQAHWGLRARKLAFGDRVSFLCQPFKGKPSRDEWLGLIDYLAALRRKAALDLAVIDSLAVFLPGRDENNAGVMLEALMPLQRLTRQGLSVLALHHPPKRETAPGRAARGSGALSGFADILVEMSSLPQAAADDRRRRLLAYSRFAETPRHLVIELNAAGTAYTGHPPEPDPQFARNWEVLRGVLEDADGKVTRSQIRADWPDDHPRPDDSSLWRWLERAIAEGLACRDGHGRKRSPFRYWLPEKVPPTASDPVQDLFAPMQRNYEEYYRRQQGGRGKQNS